MCKEIGPFKNLWADRMFLRTGQLVSGPMSYTPDHEQTARAGVSSPFSRRQKAQDGLLGPNNRAQEGW